MDTIVVSIAMMTYFHENYVADAIESVLAQKTNFSYEIVISDDGSTDGTRDILLEYQSMYPDIIRLNFNEKNIGISANHYKTRSLCKGKYIADIAGDDYWIDVNKLQKQVEFLESNPQYVATVTCVEVRPDGSEKTIDVIPEKKYWNKDISLDMYLRGIPLSTHGLVVRNYYLFEEGRNEFSLIPKASPFIDDSTECLLLLKKGTVKVMGFPSCVYRVQPNKRGKQNYNSKNTVMTHTKKMIDLYNNVDGILNIDLRNLYRINVARAILYTLLTHNSSEMQGIVNSIPKKYSRGIIVKSIPFAFKLGMETSLRKIKRRINMNKG